MILQFLECDSSNNTYSVVVNTIVKSKIDITIIVLWLL